MKLLTVIFLLLLQTTSFADLIITEHCHDDIQIVKDKNGQYQIDNEKETVCESSPSDWKET